ncbi:ribosomal protein L7/L12 [Jatrophihabitans sp. GAS493]|uniref:ribosomal protein L7/L12 n=1 Tax=Jatrophihabitans sp. GAS493 TaxID=1907575 RepID=UPI0012FE5755|nr:ribosomal protein L7/L12 [Jatrophihabitans sp. GAS493]
MLLDVGARSQNIPLIKEVRSVTGLALKPAYHLVRDVPSTVIAEIDEASATQIAAQLAQHGARVEIKIASAIEE